MSEIQKCPNLVRRGGSTFFKNVPNSKMSQRSEGGGSTLIGTLSQIFSIFYFDGSPNQFYDQSNHPDEYPDHEPY